MRQSAQFALCALYSAVAASESQKPLLDGDKSVGGSPFTEEYAKHVGELLEEWHVPGVAIGIVDGDDIWTEGFGIATYPSTPVTSSTLFYCASTSKAFTAAALSIMIDSGNYTAPAVYGQQLAWDTPVHNIIPEDFVLTDEWATTHITIEDALSHRTGMPRHDKASTHRVASPDGDGTRTATVRDGVRFLRYLPLNAAPRTKWQYCNQMYVVATHVVETLTGGRWLGDVLREWIWEPLGMRSTYFSLPDALAAPEHFAGGYAWDGKEFVSVPYMPVDEIGGAGSVISNVDDYTKWIRSLLREDGPVPKSGHAAIKTPRMIVKHLSALPSAEGPYDAPEMYALGWELMSYKGHRFWTHAGGMHAYGAEVFFFPDLDFGVVALGNTAMSSNYVELLLVWELVDEKLGIPQSERFNWTAAFKGQENRTDMKLEHAIDKYYPDRPEHSIPLSLPIEGYTGTYYHPGYLNFTVELADPGKTTRAKAALTATRPYATWPSFNEFEHVSGEYWMIFMYTRKLPIGVVNEYAPAQFRVGSDGKANALGITWLSIAESEEDNVEGLVWFERIE
ncbi:hypothetical protein J7T55_014816 [Diaporthe amygdali]|uniref:uncharacterized protein n=1 Tax=Phomopsis amygdali TaxID=1214568 RepID=UPI0022FF3F92|nr:uncharacterized protein J7T55_014816 [Diaporthe amygdali]KAJ0110014.1 hypothetical protein J7T55_014816 [Diaporthe amygdali]